MIIMKMIITSIIIKMTNCFDCHQKENPFDNYQKDSNYIVIIMPFSKMLKTFTVLQEAIDLRV